MFRDHSAKDAPRAEPWVDGPEHTRDPPPLRRGALSADALSLCAGRAERAHRRPADAAAVLRLSRMRLRCRCDQSMTFTLGGEAAGRAAADTGIAAGLRASACRRAAGTIIGPARAVPGGDDGKPITLTETPRLDRLPVFVRAGTILPRQPLVQSTQQKPEGPLSLDMYPGDDCDGVLYADDGHSMAYAGRGFLRQRLRCAATPTAGDRLRRARRRFHAVVEAHRSGRAWLAGRRPGGTRWP